MGPKQQTKSKCNPLLLGGVWLVRLHSNAHESISVIDITCFSNKAEKNQWCRNGIQSEGGTGNCICTWLSDIL